jgi:hypothetical protein
LGEKKCALKTPEENINKLSYLYKYEVQDTRDIKNNSVILLPEEQIAHNNQTSLQLNEQNYGSLGIFAVRIGYGDGFRSKLEKLPPYIFYSSWQTPEKRNYNKIIEKHSTSLSKERRWR